MASVTVSPNERGAVERRAVKNYLRPEHFNSEIVIPRAAPKRFPSNVSNFKRSVSARLPRRQFSVSNEFKTVPIDIATLGDIPPPKIPVSRGIGRSYSNKAPLTPSPTPTPSGSGGGFLYTGNYNPNGNVKNVTKPIPLLGRSTSFNLHDRSTAQAQKEERPATAHAQILEEEDEVDNRYDQLKDPHKFDDWAASVYGVDNSNKKINEAAAAHAQKNNAQVHAQAPQQTPDWVFGPGIKNKGKNPFSVDPNDKKPPAKKEKNPLASVFGEHAKESGMEAGIALASGGDLDLGTFVDPTNIVSGVGGHLGGKAGAKLGKALGNEEIGGVIGEQLGGMAGEAAGDAAMGAAGDLLAGEGLQPPQVPDAGALCAKCTIM